MISATLSVTREEFEVDQTYVFWWLVSLSPHLARLFPDPTHNGDLCMHFLFSPTVIDNVMNGFGKEGKALQQNGSLFFLTWKQMSFKKCCCIHLQIAVEWTITGWRRGRFLFSK